MHALEDRMWWYRGLRALTRYLLDTSLKRAGVHGQLLDAGCGTGGMLLQLGSEVCGCVTLGIEYDFNAALLASEKSRQSVVAGSVHQLPLLDCTLAGYISLDVLCHDNVDPSQAIVEARRCLVSGGIAVINLPAYNWLLSAHDRRVHNARRFTRGQLHELLARFGFVPMRTTYWNTLLFPIMLFHRLLESKGAASDVRDFLPLINRLLSWVLAIERTVLRLGFNLPFGGSLMVVARCEK